MPSPSLQSPAINTPTLLEAFFESSQDGFFFMMLDQPVEWGPAIDKDAVLDYVFSHQHMTKVNPAMAKQFRARPAELIGLTPSDFFRHDLEAGRRGWRALFDAGHTHSITNERRLDGSTMAGSPDISASSGTSPIGSSLWRNWNSLGRSCGPLRRGSKRPGRRSGPVSHGRFTTSWARHSPP